MLTTALLLTLAAVPAAELEWHHGDLTAALERAGADDSAVLMYFWSDGSQHCQAMYAQTLQAESVADALNDVVLVSANVGDEAGAALMRRFNVETMPTCLILDDEGNPEDVILGFAPPNAFLHELNRVASGEGTVSSLRRQLAATDGVNDPNLAARLVLSNKLNDVGNRAEAEALRASIRADDPKGVTLTGAEVLLSETVEAVTMTADGDWLEASDWDLEPVYALAKRSRQDAVRYHAWNSAANLESERGELERARRNLMKARDYLPAAQLCDWSQQVTWFFLRDDMELNSRDKRFAVELAADAVAFVEAMHLGPSAELPPERCWTGTEAEHRAYLARHVDTLAWAHYYTGDSAAAIELAQRCCELDPGYDEYRSRAETFARPLEG